MTGITWIHLSDWHEGVEDYKPDLINCDRDTVLEALVRDIQERTQISSDLAEIDFIVFSGIWLFQEKKSNIRRQRLNSWTKFLMQLGVGAIAYLSYLETTILIEIG